MFLKCWKIYHNFAILVIKRRYFYLIEYLLLLYFVYNNNEEDEYIYKKAPEPEVISFLLTDIEGNKTYAIALKYHREFYCCLNV